MPALSLRTPRHCVKLSPLCLATHRCTIFVHQPVTPLSPFFATLTRHLQPAENKTTLRAIMHFTQKGGNMRSRDRAVKTNWVCLPLRSGEWGLVAVGALCPSLGTVQMYSSQPRANGSGNSQSSCSPIRNRRQKRKGRNPSTDN
jgi:hypothetical protein